MIFYVTKNITSVIISSCSLMYRFLLGVRIVIPGNELGSLFLHVKQE